MRRSIKDIGMRGKRVFVRVDYNVPLENGVVTSDKRIQATAPTIKHLVQQGARVILASHLGRPKGKHAPEFSLAPVAKKASEILGREVKFVEDCVGPAAEAAVGAMKDGEIILLENLRFYKEEEANDPEFSKKLANLCDIYVNDAFGAAHRAHASTVGVPALVKPAVSGLLMEAELNYLGNALSSPAKPFVAVLGGAKISDKIPVIENLLDKVDTLVIGGGMAFTFLKAMGNEIGKSLLEPDQVEHCSALLEKAKAKKVKIVLPVDFVVAPDIKSPEKASVVRADAIPADQGGFDIGPISIKLFALTLGSAKTVVWNGPMGVFEIDGFAAGTLGIAKAMADSMAVTIVGGGDSVSAVTKLGLASKMSHISTGGGASIEFLEGKKLPGVEALENA